jgi:integrase
MAAKPQPPRLIMNASGIYEVRWSENGRSRTKSTGEKTLREAGRKLAEWAEDMQCAVKPAGGSKISQILDTYWHEHAQNVQSSATTACHINWLKQGLGYHEASDLSAGDITTYVRKRSKGLLGAQCVSNGTIRRELAILKAALTQAVDQRIVRVDQLPAIKLPPAGDPRDRYLELDEISRLLAEARRISAEEGAGRLSRIERFLWIALQTGARRDAVIWLEWDRIDFTRRLIDFRDPDLKTTKKRRVQVPISDQLLPVLTRAYHERKGDYVLDTAGPLRSVFDRACREAKLDDVSFHVLRHTWASHASMQGVSLTDISRVLGNTLAVCEKHYAKYQPGYLTNAVNQAYGGMKFDIEEHVS